jgi:hypothetical protein
MGVGGCAVACIEMRRQFVGGDKDLIVYQRTIKRVYEAAKQLIKTGLLFYYFKEIKRYLMIK